MPSAGPQPIFECDPYSNQKIPNSHLSTRLTLSRSSSLNSHLSAIRLLSSGKPLLTGHCSVLVRESRLEATHPQATADEFLR
ncbi:hypothetical protein EJD97_020943 [Solanum chilense]|uniref:Uncharacterized protein n=1 Tax=Solanum chilense TaxID=4083 RepID=A0A6N2CAH0_SOLCI|nr:hypothetical protein EJD97_020943 [Solanum chilense]